MTSLLTFLANPKRLLYVAGFLIGAYFFYSVYAAFSERNALRLDVERLEATQQALEQKLKSADRATKALEENISERQKTREEIEKIETEVNNAPKSEDGPIAPVLRRALDGLQPDNDGN